MKNVCVAALLLLTGAVTGCGSNPFASAPKFDQKKFEALYRAGKELESLSESSPEFSKLQEVLYAELSLARGRATTAEERRVVHLYDAAWNAVLETDSAYREQQLRGVKKDTKDPRQSDLWIRSWQLLGAANLCYTSVGKDCAEPEGSSKVVPKK